MIFISFLELLSFFHSKSFYCGISFLSTYEIFINLSSNKKDISFIKILFLIPILLCLASFLIFLKQVNCFFENIVYKTYRIKFFV